MRAVVAVFARSHEYHMAKREQNGLSFLFTPAGPGQSQAVELWKRSRILFLLGAAGTGKTSCALGLALREVLNSDRKTLWLTRPQVECDEESGLLPGTLREKLLPWLGPFSDVVGALSDGTFADLERQLAHRLEVQPVGLMRGRTVHNGVLIADEAQNCTFNQLKCLVTRIGRGGRAIICGDTEQSDLFKAKDSPLAAVAKKLEQLDAVSVVRFNANADQLRDPILSDILRLL